MAIGGTAGSGILNAVCDVLWHAVPALAGRVSRALTVVVGDGQYLCAWRLVGILAPLAALAAGAVFGARLVPSGTPFTASLATMAILFAMGGLGAGLGMWALIGYAVGDLAFGPHVALRLTAGSAIAQLMWARVPQFVSYGMLAMLMVGFPLTAQVARLDTSVRLPLAGRARTILDAGLQAVLLGGLGWAWALAAAPLIRPLYTWVGLLPDVRAIAPLQQQGALLAVVGAVVGAARVVLEERALRSPAVLERLLHAGTIVESPRPGVARRCAGIAMSALATTLLASGVLANLGQGVAFGVAVAVVLVARDLVSARVRSWPVLAARIPIIVRLAAGLGVTVWASQAILYRTYWTTRSFLPMALVVITSVAAFALLFPPDAVTRPDTESRRAPR